MLLDLIGYYFITTILRMRTVGNDMLRKSLGYTYWPHKSSDI